MQEPELLRMADLARQSGVPAATIKHYMREGLLPGPRRKTARNMAYYDAALVERIAAIKRLQREQFLPLGVIRTVLDASGELPPEWVAARSIERTLAESNDERSKTRAELLAAGVAERELEFLEELGAVRAAGTGDQARYASDDVELLRTLGAARRAGIDATMLPVEVLSRYVEAISALVRAEVELFRDGVLPRAGDRLEGLSEVAITLSERLVVLLRRKLIPRTFEAMVGDAGAPATARRRTPRRSR
ncbi:MAG: MerR family transcriptional regulator [Polyangiaceae bacterium]|nr:MerR family transcriptional regulator [Polyangiaceae bacterium]